AIADSIRRLNTPAGESLGRVVQAACVIGRIGGIKAVNREAMAIQRNSLAHADGPGKSGVEARGYLDGPRNPSRHRRSGHHPGCDNSWPRISWNQNHAVGTGIQGSILRTINSSRGWPPIGSNRTEVVGSE